MFENKSVRRGIGLLFVVIFAACLFSPMASVVVEHGIIDFQSRTEVPGWYFFFLSVLSLLIVVGTILSFIGNGNFENIFGAAIFLNAFPLAYLLSLVLALKFAFGVHPPRLMVLICIAATMLSFGPISAIDGIAFPYLFGAWLWGGSSVLLALVCLVSAYRASEAKLFEGW